MRGPALANISVDVVKTLDATLRRLLAFEEKALPTIHQVESGSANDATHLVAVYTSGRQIGLKAAARLPQGTRKEEIASQILQALRIGGHSPGVACQAITDLGPLDGKEFVATEWNSGLNLERASPQDHQRIAQEPEHFLEAYGEWVVGCLACDVVDDKTKHWIWDEGQRKLTHVDHEEAFNGGGAPVNLRAPLASGLLAKVQAQHSPERAAVRRGIERAAQRLTTERNKIGEIATTADVKLSGWAGKTAQQFADDFLNAI